MALIGLGTWATIAIEDGDGLNLWSLLIHRESQPFNGSDLANWTGFKEGNPENPAKIFRVDNGQIVSTDPRGRIFMKHPVSDFVFKFEYLLHIRGKSDAALCLLKFHENENHTVSESAFRVSEVGCTLMSADGKFGRPGDIVPYESETRNPTKYIAKTTADSLAPADEWIRVEIRCKGRMITFSINGTEVNQVQVNGDRSIHCYPGFHHANTEMRIRNIRIKPLSPTTFDALPPPDPLPEGSVWTAKQEMIIVKANNRYPPVRLTIKTREKETFTAEWASQNQAWKITGTIKDGKIQCSAEETTGPEEGQKYPIRGTIKDKKIELVYSGKLNEVGTRNAFKATAKLDQVR